MYKSYILKLQQKTRQIWTEVECDLKCMSINQSISQTINESVNPITISKQFIVCIPAFVQAHAQLNVEIWIKSDSGSIISGWMY